MSLIISTKSLGVIFYGHGWETFRNQVLVDEEDLWMTARCAFSLQAFVVVCYLGCPMAVGQCLIVFDKDCSYHIGNLFPISFIFIFMVNNDVRVYYVVFGID